MAIAKVLYWVVEADYRPAFKPEKDVHCTFVDKKKARGLLARLKRNGSYSDPRIFSEEVEGEIVETLQ